MKVRAKISFCGAVSMAANEERDFPQSEVLSDLLSAGYVIPVKAEGGATNEGKRSNSGNGKKVHRSVK